MLRVARLVLVGLDAGTWAAMLFFVVQAAALLLGLPFATGRLARAALPGEAAAVAHWLLAVLAVGVATGWAVDRLSRGLLAMLDTAAAGRSRAPTPTGCAASPAPCWRCSCSTSPLPASSPA